MNEPLNNLKIHKSSFFIILIALNSCLGSFFFGYQLGVINMAQETLDVVLNVSDTTLDNGLITSAMPLGAAIGSFLIQYILIYISRRGCMILADCIGIISCILMGIQSLWVVIIGRFISGFVVGINSALVPLYILEISPSSISGLTGSLQQAIQNLGVLVSYLFGLGFSVKDNLTKNEVGDIYWRVVLMFPIITQLLRILILQFFFNFDSPIYYLQHQQEEKATQVLQKIYNVQFVDQVLKDYKVKANVGSSINITWGMLFCGNKLQRRTLTGIFLQIFQQLSGINAVVFYSSNIFRSSTNNVETALHLTVISGVVQMISSFLTSVISKKIGRRTLLLGGDMFCGIQLIILGILSLLQNQDSQNDVLSAFIIAFIFIFMFTYQLSLGPIVWVYNAETLPVKGVSVATLSNWTFCFAIGLTFPILVDAWQIQTMFFIFSGCCLLGYIHKYFYTIETKGLNSQQIESQLDKSLKTESEETSSLLQINN